MDAILSRFIVVTSCVRLSAFFPYAILKLVISLGAFSIAKSNTTRDPSVVVFTFLKVGTGVIVGVSVGAMKLAVTVRLVGESIFLICQSPSFCVSNNLYTHDF